MRKHQIDLVAQRDSRLKILEEKYAKLDQQYSKLLKVAQTPETPSQPKPVLKKIQANPDLFND